MTQAEPAWTFWPLGKGHSTLALHERFAGGIALELHVFDGGGRAATHAAWRLGDTGQVLVWLHAGSA